MKTLHRIIQIAALLAIGIMFLSKTVQAQAVPKFKVGDHVEFSQNSACIGDRFALPGTGTIVQVNTTSSTGNYVIQFDPNGGGSGTIVVPIRHQDCGMKTGAAPPKKVDAENNGATTGNKGNAVTPNDNARTTNQGGAKFKVGDRVEFSANNACLGAQYAIPTKGTIEEVNSGMTSRNYVILADPLPGQAPRHMTIPMAREECGMRALGGPAPNIQVDKLRVDENGTVLADRELLDCEHFNHAGRNGSAPPPELVKKLIRCLYEKPSAVGSDGATTMDITSFSIGAPHRWRLYEDRGQGTANTMVYPVHVKWNTKKFTRTRNDVVTGQEQTFTCFADADNLWQCGQATGGVRKDGTKQEIMVKP